MAVSSYVPNDTFLVGGKPEEESPENAEDSSDDTFEAQEAIPRSSTLVLTGPNYSGKSVYMKQASRT